MTQRPVPTLIYHFTRVEHLETIVRDGLLSDNHAQAAGVLQVEVGNRKIKADRRDRVVPRGPMGVVADYVPFYYAPRSPMLYSIHKGNVPTYNEGCERLVFLVTSVEQLHQDGLAPVFTDRNAVLVITEFRDDVSDLDDLVDWSVITARYWTNFPEGPELRQAECLVHGRVPWGSVQGLAARSQAVADEAQAVLDTIGETRFRARVRPELYF